MQWTTASDTQNRRRCTDTHTVPWPSQTASAARSRSPRPRRRSRSQTSVQQLEASNSNRPSVDRCSRRPLGRMAALPLGPVLPLDSNRNSNNSSSSNRHRLCLGLRLQLGLARALVLLPPLDLIPIVVDSRLGGRRRLVLDRTRCRPLSLQHSRLDQATIPTITATVVVTIP